MKIEIDQSGKIEKTEKDTILAFATNNKRTKITGSIKISARTKRRLQESFRQIGEPRKFVVNLFSCAVFLLVKNRLKNVSEINIDTEYPGKGKSIKETLAKMFFEANIEMPPIRFVLIGKKSFAHEVALRTYHKLLKADQFLDYEILKKNIFKTKNGCSTLKYQVSDKR